MTGMRTGGSPIRWTDAASCFSPGSCCNCAGWYRRCFVMVIMCPSQRADHAPRTSLQSLAGAGSRASLQSQGDSLLRPPSSASCPAVRGPGAIPVSCYPFRPLAVASAKFSPDGISATTATACCSAPHGNEFPARCSGLDGRRSHDVAPLGPNSLVGSNIAGKRGSCLPPGVLGCAPVHPQQPACEHGG